MGLVLETLFLIILIILGYKWYEQWYKKYTINKKLNWIFDVPGWPLIGNALEFGESADFISNFEKLVGKYGKLFKGNLLGEVNLVSTDYDFAEYILGTHHVLNKANWYRFAHSWLGQGLLTSEGPKWRNRRKMITPAFHLSILEQYIDCFEVNGRILIEQLEKELDKDSVDIYPYISLYTLDVICETAMGVSVNVQKNKNSKYVKNIQQLCEVLFNRAFGFLKRFDFFYNFTIDNYKELKALKEIHSHTNSVIDARRKELEIKPKTEIGIVKDDLGRKRKMDFLDILLQSSIDGEPLSREDIREEVDTFMFEGHDTSSSAISFTIFLLANHPEVQMQALKEQQNIFCDDITRNATYNDLQAMKYLELVIKESLRLYPPVAIIGRSTNKDVEFKGNILPKDVDITIFIYGMLRDPDNFNNPNEFDPNRCELNEGTRHFSFIPFSAGPRNCIGQKFAMLEIKSTLSTILRNFELLPSIPEHRVVLLPEVVLKSRNGIKIKLTRRKW